MPGKYYVLFGEGRLSWKIYHGKHFEYVGKSTFEMENDVINKKISQNAAFS